MDGGLPIREFRPSKEPARDPNSPLRAAAAAAAAEEAERSAQVAKEACIARKRAPIHPKGDL